MIKVKNSVDYIEVFFTQITASISCDTLKHIIGVFGKQSTPAPETVTVRKNDFALKTRKVSLVPKLVPPEPPNRGGGTKMGPVNSQYVVLFTQRLIKVP